MEGLKKCISGIFRILCVVFVITVFTGCDEVAKQQMQTIENQVTEDAIKQYEIAYRQGDKMQIYVQAGMVAAAYLQAQDEENYRKWKAIEKEAGKKVGL